MGSQEQVLLDLDHYRSLSRGIVTYNNRRAHRSVGNPSAQFAIGSFQCELAHLAGLDPVMWFLKNLGEDRILSASPYETKILDELLYDTAKLRRVIERVIVNSNWGSKLELDEGMGFSAYRSQGT
ncbi:MAG: isoquinoline 1-oxidoreductase beta subunit [Paraglaciecola sp.]|jgi:isoquinoline 1-oxidoreductase beta subunit